MRSLISLLVVLAAVLVLAHATVTHLPLYRTALPANSPHLPQSLRPVERYAKLVNSTPQSFQTGGNIIPVGIYYVQIGLGTPTQYVRVAIDTGSTDLIVPGLSCTSCHSQQGGQFNSQASSTLQGIKCLNSESILCHACLGGDVCTFENSYETCNLSDPDQLCTVNGTIFGDQFAMGLLSTRVVFGLIAYQTRNIIHNVIDGLMGFSFQRQSSFNSPSAFERLVNAGQTAWIFAMCMNSTAGGVLTLGGYDSKYYTGAIQWSPQIKFGLEYALTFNGATVDGKPVPITTLGGAIIDSGTNVLLLSSKNFLNIQNAIIKAVCPGTIPGFCSGTTVFSGACFSYTQDQLNQLPELSLILDGATLTLTGSQYMVRNVTAAGNVYCLGLQNSGPFNLNIIGDVVMQAYYVIFDNVNRRIGWASVNSQNCIGTTF